MLLIYPPLAKGCEPPAGIAKLAAQLRSHGRNCLVIDANIEGIIELLTSSGSPDETWGRRAHRNLARNLAAIRSGELYTSPARYQRAVLDLNHLLELKGRGHQLSITLADYRDTQLSPLQSADLLQAAAHYQTNIFYPYFARRLPELLATTSTKFIGISINYLSQALCAFALIGFLKAHYPGRSIILGGGLITSWLRNPSWRNPFAGLVDQLIAGPGEKPLLSLLLGEEREVAHQSPDYHGLIGPDHLAPGVILPYAASSGCYWRRCSFCPEQAEQNPYTPLSIPQVAQDLRTLVAQHRPVLIHFLDNGLSPALLQSLAAQPPGPDWYGFARISPLLTDYDFCKALRHAGCVMLKLGLESGAQGVLDAMDKGIDLTLTSNVLAALKAAGIATYIYLLFGTPAESLAEARQTLDFVVRQREAITYLNLAIFNMPLSSTEASSVRRADFYHGDLSLYTDFSHPRGWDRKTIRQFLAREFRRHPAIAPILHRDPPFFTSNHAPFFYHCLTHSPA